MYNAPEGEWLKLNFIMVVQNFISKYSQSSLIPGMEIFLRAKGNPGLVYFATLCRVIENKDTMEMINSANPCPQNF